MPARVVEKLGLKPGDSVAFKETKEGFVIKLGEELDFLARFRAMLNASPKRTGEPENWPPEKMKRIWLG